MPRKAKGTAASTGTGTGAGTGAAAAPSARRTKRKAADDDNEDQRADILQNMTTAFEDEMEDYFGEDGDDDEESSRQSNSAPAASSTDVALASGEEAHRAVFYDARGAPRSIIGLIGVLNNVVTASLTTDPMDVVGRPKLTPIKLVDLVLLGAHIGFRLNTKKFAAAILSCFEPNCCVMISGRGKILCAGCGNMDDAMFAIEQILQDVRPLTPAYANLRAFDARVRNIVGTTCFPHQIDVKRLLEDNPEMVGMRIANGVRIPPPPPEGVPPMEPEPVEEETRQKGIIYPRKTKKRESRKNPTGITLVYESGYLLVIGAKSVEAMVKTYHYVYPIVSKYFVGSAETSFTADNIRRYYTGLKAAFQNSETSPKSYIAVREDGTRGTVEEWRLSHDVEENIKNYKLLTQNQHGAMKARLASTKPLDAVEYNVSSKALVMKKPDGALVTVSDGAGALVNMHDGSAMSLVRVSKDFKKKRTENVATTQSMNRIAQNQLVASMVDEYGADHVVQAQKPTHVMHISTEKAAGLARSKLV